VYLFKINLKNLTKDLNKYKSLQDFFSRKIKNRKIDKNQNILIAPCDGFFGESGGINFDKLIQAKGVYYNINSLFCNKNIGRNFLNGNFVTIYLSPSNYHRFHMPLDGYIINTIYIPGAFFPVKKYCVKNIRNLFCINERIIVIVKSRGFFFAIVAIGAMIVGKISLVFNKKELKERIFSRKVKENQFSIFFKKGVEVGKFKFGSTIILLFSKNFIFFEKVKKDSPIFYGKKIGRIKNSIF
jgi:phosphatidylserine decarboxylase